MRPTNLVMFDKPMADSPYGLNAPLFDKITAAEYEGLWTPLFGVKSATLEINGKMDSLGVDLYGTNVQDPMNGYIATVAGTAQAGDEPAITFNNPNLPNAAPVTVSHIASSSDSLTSIAAALVALINANTALAGLGIQASNLAGVITINWPSIAPVSAQGVGAGNPSGPPIANTLFLSVAVWGSGPTTTLAVTLPTTGIKIGSTLAALGLTALTPIPRYIKARVTTLTGTGANVSGNLQGSV